MQIYKHQTGTHHSNGDLVAKGCEFVEEWGNIRCLSWEGRVRVCALYYTNGSWVTTSGCGVNTRGSGVTARGFGSAIISSLHTHTHMHKDHKAVCLQLVCWYTLSIAIISPKDIEYIYMCIQFGSCI